MKVSISGPEESLVYWERAFLKRLLKMSNTEWGS